MSLRCPLCDIYLKMWKFDQAFKHFRLRWSSFPTRVTYYYRILNVSEWFAFTNDHEHCPSCVSCLLLIKCKKWNSDVTKKLLLLFRSFVVFLNLISSSSYPLWGYQNFWQCTCVCYCRIPPQPTLVCSQDMFVSPCLTGKSCLEDRHG